MTDKRKLRLVMPCEDYGICWIKGAHIYDENEALDYLKNHKHFKGSVISAIVIDNYGYCAKMFEKDCDNLSEWVCEGKYAWFDCSKELKGAVPYTSIEYQTEEGVHP